jgi:DNA-directed RNA polymerase specialized sigma24 family protein
MVVSRPSSDTAFADFYRAHRRDAVRWAVALVGDRAAAEDLAEDALTTVGRRLGSLDNPAGYLRRCVVNGARSWHRSRGRELRRLLRLGGGLTTAYSEPTNEMLDALSGLPYKQRAAVTLRYWADWDDAEIAEALGCAPATVRVLVHRAIGTLKETVR